MLKHGGYCWNKDKEEEKSRGQVVLSYIKGLSEAVERVMKKHGVGAAMCPHDTLRRNLGEKTNVLYQTRWDSWFTRYHAKTVKVVMWVKQGGWKSTGRMQKIQLWI